MATRRPPPTRSRAIPPQGPSSRPRSVMARSGASEEVPEGSHAPQKRAASTKPATDLNEINIQVVVRSRRRSEREIQDASPIIVTSTGAKSKEVTIETSSPVSSLGTVSLSPTKTYPFDLVFGPEADQLMIYHDVVSPMLEEVILGYNCTLFAYGQTGTGKTYTMQGDLKPTPMGNPSAQAGMIPRVLFHLFHQLEKSGTDYSVKISYVELYNEEIRDLLTGELAAPSGNTQPMGKNDAHGQPGGMKIFEDSGKRGGVFIQGLEEIAVKDSADALALLTKGSDRRQIAATNFNDHSSRSHSIFAITVHTKETSTMGEDLLKVGKLNLVDLAGSENIGRSGAENTRAREAGMINQSLLTLGRVINALVDRNSHVPYRESKLTRLLQDSLGGRTKTCIIATVSPARSNREETLSTLDYAIRAKSIRNKPELNQRMTRNALLKEYVGEIERLKADLLAAREKNGIFFSEETWVQMAAEKELKETELEEAKKQVDIIESRMRSVREEFEQSIGMLLKREGELKETRETLSTTTETLVSTEGELKVVKGAFEEEVVVRQAHQETEEVLDDVATGLKRVAAGSLNDVGGLFDKLERKSDVFDSNSKAVQKHGKVLVTEASALATRLEDFIKSANERASELRTSALEYQSVQQSQLTAHSERIDIQHQSLQSALDAIRVNDKASGEALDIIQSVLQKTQEMFKTGFGTWSKSLSTSCEVLCKDLEKTGLTGFESMEKALKAMGSLVDSVVRESREFMDAERDAAVEVRSMVGFTVNAENKRLREENGRLLRLLEDEKVKGERDSAELIQRVSGLLGDYSAARDRGLREAVSGIQAETHQAEERMSAFATKHGKLVDGMLSRSIDVGGSLERRSGEGKRTRDGALKTLDTTKKTFADDLGHMKISVATSISTYSAQAQRETQSMTTTSNGAFERHSRTKKARINATETMVSGVQTEYRHMQEGVASTSKHARSMSDQVLTKSDHLAHDQDTYHQFASSHLSTVDKTSRSLLSQGTREDVPTGSTPRKRLWEYTDEWELTKPRDLLLGEWREKGVSAVGSETFLAEHLPLPAGESLEEEQEPVGLLLAQEPVSQGPTPTLSMTSSTSSSTSSVKLSAPPPPPLACAPSIRPLGLHRKASSKSGLPSMGIMTERPTNVTRGTRRAR